MADFEGFNISELPPEALEQLIAMGVLDEEQANLAKQVERAQGIRSARGPRGRHTGRTYVAANPLEHIGDVLGKRRAGKEIGVAEDRMEAILGEKTAGRELFAKLAYPKSPAQAPMPGSSQAGPMGPPEPPPTQNPGMGMPPPQAPQAPPPNIPPPNMNIPQDQFNIDAMGGTTRGPGSVSVGGVPPSQSPGVPPIRSVKGLAPELWEPDAQQPKPPMTAAQKYAEALRKMGGMNYMGPLGL